MQAAATNSRFQQLWVQVHSSLWFVPTFVILGLMLLALGLVELDRQAGDAFRQRWPELFMVKAEEARSLLSTIAGSMATVAGVTFSITMVALTLASAQYTSRVMRNFMRDRGTQVVLGIFMGIFLYCLLVLRAINAEPDSFVPACAVLGSIVLSMLGSGAFIFFIHHISANIQAAEMAQAITRETLDMVDKYFPEQAGEGKPSPAGHLDVSAWYPVPARQWGTVQTVDEMRLLAWACQHDAVVRMEYKPGEFVAIGETLVSVAMRAPPDEGMIAALNGAYGIDAFRTLDQDPTFGVRQLVDMALKALSPGINDSTTTETCLDHIGVILACCGQRKLQPRDHYDRQGKLRVLSIDIDFAQLTRLAFHQVAESAEGNSAVLLRIMDTICKAGKACAGSAQRGALLDQAEVVGEIALRTAKSDAARAELGARLNALRELLASP
ncbi:DUF2254 domain-containing protein [Massilia alkalitolerans]|uniref:DUF2254 domain-containing protein n=1 Tax=Massilia alkalitolerans TaxID=286638 RepID=UPI000425D3B1|nr:DUF2254 domain-containing protein [Massilia alkalitolerans]